MKKVCQSPGQIDRETDGQAARHTDTDGQVERQVESFGRSDSKGGTNLRKENV